MKSIALLSFIALIIYLIFNRSNVLCSIAEFRYGMGHTQSALKLYKFAAKIGKIKFVHRVRRAYLTLKEGDVDEANKLLEKAPYAGLVKEQKEFLEFLKIYRFTK